MQDGLKQANYYCLFYKYLPPVKRFLPPWIARLQKENIDFVYYGGYYPEMGQMLRQARATALRTSMGPKALVTRRCPILRAVRRKA